MLDQRKKGGLLHYQRAGTTVQAPPTAEKSKGVYAKLDIRKHSLEPWLRDTLRRQFDYLCCDDVDSFQQTPERAMTKNKHIKHGNNRHEKDDRRAAVDRSNFVLGWDNKEKCLFLKERIEEIQRKVTLCEEKLREWDSTLVHLRFQIGTATALLEIKHFSDIDERPSGEALSDLREQLHLLITGSEAAQKLEERKNKIEATITLLEQKYTATARQQGSLEMNINQINEVIKDCQATIETSKADGTFFSQEAFFEDWNERLGDHFDSGMTGCRDRCREIKRELLERTKGLLSAMEPVNLKIESAMARYLVHFPEHQTDLNSTISSLSGFEHILSRIEKDDLPRHEEKFREYLDDKVTHELQFLDTKLKNEQREIRNKIDVLNSSLQQLEYSHSTYMRLDVRDSNDPQIVDFRRRMSDCLDYAFAAGFSVSEERYKKLAQLITDLETEHGWTEKVVDVRRWFTFLAQELDAETGVCKNTYEDSSGQSGGEKAKLAFTILVASIAYQYDIDPKTTPSDRFHFVMVDEMFSKIDDQFSDYALRLFEKFRLQLLIVAPLDAKARVTEPFVKKYLHVVKDQITNRSRIYTMSAIEFEKYADEIKAN